MIYDSPEEPKMIKSPEAQLNAEQKEDKKKDKKEDGAIQVRRKRTLFKTVLTDFKLV